MSEISPEAIGLKDYGSKEDTIDHYDQRFKLALIGGCLGLHRFFEREFGMGFLYLFTMGLFGFGWIIDAIGAWNDLQNLRRLYSGGYSNLSNTSANRREKTRVKPNYDEMSGAEFERFVAEVLRANGFQHVQITKDSADHGVDIIAKKDSKKYVIQCKRYKSNVGNKAVQEIFTAKAIYDGDVAVVITNSHFTKQAIEDARKIGVELWDRRELERLIRAGW